MKILLTGGGTGGHFYPIIAVTEALYNISKEKRLLTPELIFMSDTEYDKKVVLAEGLKFKKVQAGKIRRYFSLLNITDTFKTGTGVLKAIFSVYSDMPDVVFGKGGYASFPALMAAKIFNIPTIIHESDTVPGKVNKWAGKFAQRVAVSFPEAADHFPKEKTILTGTPVRKNILGGTPEEARELLNLEPDTPIIFVLGGSQGAQKINNVILDSLDRLVKNVQIIHQCGSKNKKEVEGRAKVILENSQFKTRYHLYSYMNDSFLRNSASVANLVISRAGGSAIYEIASWGLPSIIIPLKNSAQNHQAGNAYSYKKAGACEIIEENNLTTNVLLSEISRLLSNKDETQRMKEAARNFAKLDAAQKIAKEIIKLALKHAK